MALVLALVFGPAADIAAGLTAVVADASLPLRASDRLFCTCACCWPPICLPSSASIIASLSVGDPDYSHASTIIATEFIDKSLQYSCLHLTWLANMPDPALQCWYDRRSNLQDMQHRSKQWGCVVKVHTASNVSPADLSSPAGEGLGLEKRSLPSVDREFQKELSCEPLNCPLLSLAKSCTPRRVLCQSLGPCAQRAAFLSWMRLHYVRNCKGRAQPYQQHLPCQAMKGTTTSSPACVACLAGDADLWQLLGGGGWRGDGIGEAEEGGAAGAAGPGGLPAADCEVGGAVAVPAAHPGRSATYIISLSGPEPIKGMSAAACTILSERGPAC